MRFECKERSVRNREDSTNRTASGASHSATQSVGSHIADRRGAGDTALPRALCPPHATVFGCAAGGYLPYTPSPTGDVRPDPPRIGIRPKLYGRACNIVKTRYR